MGYFNHLINNNMNYKKTISVFNGNNERFTRNLPTIYLPKFGNEVAKKHFERNTGLKLSETYVGLYKVKPKSFKQIYKIFVTYNFKTTFYDNATEKNTLVLKWNND